MCAGAMLEEYNDKKIFLSGKVSFLCKIYIFLWFYSSNMAATHRLYNLCDSHLKRETLLNYRLESCTGTCVYVVVNFLFQLIFIFPLFWGMVMYANEFKTKEKQKLTEIKN